MKAIIFYAYLALVIVSVLVADINIIPLVVCCILLVPIWKIFSNMNSDEVNKTFGIIWLNTHFNNPLIKDLLDE